MPMPLSSPPDPPPTTTPRVFSNPQQPSSRPLTPSFPQSQTQHRYRPPAAYPHTQQYSVQAQSQPLAPRAPNSVHPQPQLTKPAHEQGIIYPLASSGRGFLPKLNPGFPPRPGVSFPHQPGRPFGFSDHVAQGQQRRPHLIRPTHLQHSLLGGAASSASGAAVNHVMPPGVVKGVPVQSKVAPPLFSVSDCNGYKEIRDRSRDDTSATVRDRKVRITDDTSLYALCRSWLRNGYSEQTQPQYLNAVQSLPRPLPLAVAESHSPTKGEADIEEEDEAVDDLSPQELLQRHVKRAKRVRARLREERLRRISRYRTRLVLLLPPIVEQQYREEYAAENGST